MPVADNKSSKKTKKGAVKAPPPPAFDITVKDCMVWPEPKPKGKALKGSETEAKQAEIYRSTLIRREVTSENPEDITRMYPPSFQPRKDDGTAIEALRGWPGSKEEQANCSDYIFEYEAKKDDMEQTAQVPVKNSKGKKTKKKDAKETDEPVYMSDLMQHRYLNEYAEKRRREMERERRRKEAVEAIKAGRRFVVPKNDVKANRTSQLRTIALADKVETSPLDLWKMPRFTKGAEPHLQTTANGAALHNKRVRAKGGRDCDFDVCEGGACCCEYSQRATNYADLSEEELQMGADGGNP